MTLIWFVIWLCANLLGDQAPLRFDPVNWWAGAFLLALALDLGRQHAGHRDRGCGGGARGGKTESSRDT